MPASKQQGAKGLAVLDNSSWEEKGATYFDLTALNWLLVIFGGLKVNVDRVGTGRFMPLALPSCCFMERAPATTPSPVSTKAWPLEPALDPNRGISFLAWKFRGLLPLTTIGAVVDSVSVTLVPSVKVPITFR